MANTFRSAFEGPNDEYSGMGKRPVVFDIMAPDGTTSMLPDHLKMVLHVNPTSFKPTNSKLITRIKTIGGWVEQHWGEGSSEVTLEMATGGFMRLYSGLSSTTGGPFAYDIGGTRRDTIAYDKYLDLLALFKNNGAIYDARGTIALQGQIKISFDGESHYGWFNSFSVSESADKPYMFNISAGFTLERSERILHLHQPLSPSSLAASGPRSGAAPAQGTSGGKFTSTALNATKSGAKGLVG